jgi:CheY-like chemotaxis protein
VTKVLYVEHNDDNLYMLKTRLELRGGFEVLAAEDSEKGCRLAVTEHPDVILMDLEMPDDDRWEAVRRLKNDPQTRDIPIIGMSAHAVESEREKAISTGCDEFDRDHSARARAPQIAVPTVLVRMARRHAGAP